MQYVAVAEYCMVGSRIRCNIERVMKGWCCGSSWNSEQYDAREAHKGQRMIVRVIRVTVYATWLPSRGMYNTLCAEFSSSVLDIEAIQKTGVTL
jgi:hypothetical protein